MSMETMNWVELVSDRINSHQIHHHTYKITRQRLFAETLVRKGGECIALTGPSRIGKTSIAIALEQMMNPEASDDFLVRRPVVRLTCRNRGDRGTFSTKAFFLDALTTIKHPFYTVDGDDIAGNVEAIRRNDRETTASLEAVLENALQVLRTKYLVIDETQHLQYMTGGVQSALQMMEFFKTLAEKLDIVLIFIGAYPIVNVLQLSPHLLGRICTIEMQRYSSTDEEDLIRFQKVLNWYSKDVRFAKGVNGFGDWNRELFEGSLGVIGLLSAWIRNGMAEMLANGDDELTFAHMMSKRKESRFLNEMLREIVDGENYMRSAADEHFSLDSQIHHNGPVKKRKGNKRPFQAKVKRRPVGGRA